MALAALAADMCPATAAVALSEAAAKVARGMAAKDAT
jgi:hypothetical protein